MLYQTTGRADGVVGIVIEGFAADALQSIQGQLHHVAGVEVEEGALPQSLVDLD